MSESQAISLLAVLLEILVLLALLKGPVKRFPSVFAYLVVGLVGSLFEFYVVYQPSLDRNTYSRLFWTDDLLQHVLLIAIIVSLVRGSISDPQSRDRATRWLIAIAIASTVVSLIIFRNPMLNPWMIPVSRNLSFTEELFNFYLWTLLIRARNLNRQVLLVIAGLGIQVTGEVIGHSLRLYFVTPSTIWFPDFLVTACEVAVLIIWLIAFTRRPVLESALDGSKLEH